MTKIISVINQKGGVGKTGACIHIAECLSHYFRTLLIDLDPSRNASKPFINHSPFNIRNVLEDKNLDPKLAIYKTYAENLDILPSHISLAILQNFLESRVHKEKILLKQIEKIKDKYDYIIIDCPPLLTVLSTLAIYPSDFILIPTDYEADALDGISDLFKIINEVKDGQNYDYRILRNKHDKRKTIAIDLVHNALLPFKDKICRTIIYQDSGISNAKSEQKTVIKYAPLSDASHNYADLTLELMEILHA